MEVRIVIDLSTATPPYEQIQSQIASLIAVGELAQGTRLPTVRSLAADLGVAAGTVARAYKELEAAGLVATNRRQGTVVDGFRQAQTPAQTSPTASVPVPAEVMAAVDHLLVTAYTLGIDDKALVQLVQGRMKQTSRSDR